MKLLGKRVERGNAHGNALCLTLQESGHVKLSPALVSAIGIKAGVVGANKIGFAYSEPGEPVQCCVYAAIDDNGVSVNKQGRLYNMPHNRDIRNLLGLPMTEDHVINVDNEPITDVFEGYRLFELDNSTFEDLPADEKVEEFKEKYNIGGESEEKSEIPVPEFKPQPVVDGVSQDDEEEELDMF